jgi:hypothetical protein
VSSASPQLGINAHRALDKPEPGAPGLAMPVGILAGAIDFELVMGVFDQRDSETWREPRHDPFDQRRLAAAGPAGESGNAHGSLVRRPLAGGTVLAL